MKNAALAICVLVAVLIFGVPFFADLVTSSPPGALHQLAPNAVPQPMRQNIGDGIWIVAAVILIPCVLVWLFRAEQKNKPPSKGSSSGTYDEWGRRR